MLCPSPISKARTEDALLLSSSFFLSPSCSPPRQEGRLLPSLNSSSPLYNTLQTQFFTVAGFIQKHAFQAKKKNPLCFLVNFFFYPQISSVDPLSVTEISTERSGEQAMTILQTGANAGLVRHSPQRATARCQDESIRIICFFSLRP